jgi:HEXXH motif-containing protein
MLTVPKLDPESLVPPFDASLPATLRIFGEHMLFDSHTLTRESYSTERFLDGVSPDPNSGLGTIPLEKRLPLRMEAGSPGVLRYCAQHALNLASDAETAKAIDLVQDALLEVIHPYPFLWSAVSQLVWCCHMVHAPGDEFDVSFSDPAIPFSVFISAPGRKDRRSVLRVAENLVHETMHLQLTLFELCCPLIDTASSWSMYSPWKRQERPAQGMLHGLYVFSVLRWMWGQISRRTQHEIDRAFAVRRVIEINEEISSIRALEDSPAFTESGSRFLQMLFTESEPAV